MRTGEEKTEDLEVESGEWIPFLEGFSRQHEGWLVSIEVVTATGSLTEVKNEPLKGVSIDHTDGKQRAYVRVGDAPNERVTHVVTAPVRITLKQTQTGAHEGLEIMSADGSLTTIHFRCAIRPDMIDDMAS